jgi:dephospho-CoA kinase
MIIAGITGGIGSGKSTACAVFEQLGVPVYYADAESKKLFLNEEIKSLLKTKFGEEIFINGEVDRKLLAALVFSNAAKLKELNSIMHPAVKKHFEEWCRVYSAHPYVLKEAAILFESEAYKGVQKIITVTAPMDIRINRIIKRDGISKAEVQKRISSQMNDEEKISRSDFHILNNEEELMIPQILKIHKELSGIL